MRASTHRSEALADLDRLSGGSLPVGVYRCIAARSDSTCWEQVAIGAGREIGFADEEPADDETRDKAEEVERSGRIRHRV